MHRENDLLSPHEDKDTTAGFQDMVKADGPTRAKQGRGLEGPADDGPGASPVDEE